MLNEMVMVQKALRDCQSRLPLPSYFYVGRYGRSLEGMEAQICKVLEQKEWIWFQAGSSFYENGLIRSMLAEVERQQDIGKSFTGCIFIEFVGGVEQRVDFSEFLAFLKRQENVYKYVFFMKESENTEEIRQQLEQHFGIRSIYAQPYEVQELVVKLEQWLQDYSFVMTVEAQRELEIQLEQYSWKVEQQVETRLHSLVQTMIYEKILCGKELDNQIEATDVKKSMKQLQSERRNKISLGFCKEGFDYE